MDTLKPQSMPAWVVTQKNVKSGSQHEMRLTDQERLRIEAREGFHGWAHELVHVQLPIDCNDLETRRAKHLGYLKNLVITIEPIIDALPSVIVDPSASLPSPPSAFRRFKTGLGYLIAWGLFFVAMAWGRCK